VEPRLTELDAMDEFESELHASFARVPAPSELKHKVMNQLWEQAWHARRRMVWFERIAASLVVVAVMGGAVVSRNAIERHRGEEAKQQVFTALRIANRALEEMSVQLQERESTQ
jgi:hypothetical protein